MIGLPVFSLTNPWVLLTIVVGLTASHLYVYEKGRSEGESKIQANWDKANAKTADDALRKSYEIQAAIKKFGDEGEAREKALIAERDSFKQRLLSSRPVNRLPTTAPAQCGPDGSKDEGATGAQLAGPDAVFLDGYATDAGLLASKLQSCINEYNAARAKVNEANEAQIKALPK